MDPIAEPKVKQIIESVKKMHSHLSAFAKRMAAFRSKVAAAKAPAVFQEAKHTLQMITSKENELKAIGHSVASLNRALTTTSGKSTLAPKYGKDLATASKEFTASVNASAHEILALCRATRFAASPAPHATDVATGIDAMREVAKDFSRWIDWAKEMEEKRQERERIDKQEKTIVCDVDYPGFGRKPKCKVTVKKILPIARSPQVGQYDLADIYITPEGCSVHDHLAVLHHDGRGVMILRTSGTDKTPKACNFWQFGTEFGRKVADILKHFA